MLHRQEMKVPPRLRKEVNLVRMCNFARETMAVTRLWLQILYYVCCPFTQLCFQGDASPQLGGIHGHSFWSATGIYSF